MSVPGLTSWGLEHQLNIKGVDYMYKELELIFDVIIMDYRLDWSILDSLYECIEEVM